MALCWAPWWDHGELWDGSGMGTVVGPWGAPWGLCVGRQDAIVVALWWGCGELHDGSVMGTVVGLC